MQIRHLRHATMLLAVNGLKILIDPMLNSAGSAPPVKNSGNDRMNPLVELPLTEEALHGMLQAIDAVLLTHTHSDHFDGKAAEIIPKNKPVFCQPKDEEKLKGLGFTEIHPIHSEASWQGIHFTRTGGKHGRGLTGKAMGVVSGYVLKAAHEPSIYIAGDTVWCSCVKKALEKHRPDITVVFSGSARFLTGGPITMTAEHVCRVFEACAGTKVVAVHMEAINHCLLSRKALEKSLRQKGYFGQAYIPADGETLDFPP